MERCGLTGRAYFVRFPSRIEDLWRLHLLTDRVAYIAVKTVTLPRIDYENFITDMTVERAFLEKYAPLCRPRPDGPFRGILARQRGRTDGVLVLPNPEGFVLWAAYIPDAEGASD